MDDAAFGDPVVAWVLMKGGGQDSVGENAHAGRAQHGRAELLSKSSGVMAVLGVGIEKLFIAGGVEGRKQGNGAGNLGEREDQFVGGL